MYNTARQLYFWPGMKNAIVTKASNCSTCTEHQRSRTKAPLRSTLPSSAGGPMQSMGTDLFQACGKQWIVLVDRFSGYCFIKQLRSTTSASIIATLTDWFLDYGWPQSIRSDGGPQFRSEFQKFCRENQIIHELSAPYNPEANGLAEAAVKSMKNIIIRTKESQTDLHTALATWRNMTRDDGTSPADLFFGRRQRLPNLPEMLSSKAADVSTTKRDRTYQQVISSKNASRSGNFKARIGEKVIIQDQSTGKIRSHSSLRHHQERKSLETSGIPDLLIGFPSSINKSANK